jgi:hypothetical protein
MASLSALRSARWKDGRVPLFRRVTRKIEACSTFLEELGAGMARGQSEAWWFAASA